MPLQSKAALLNSLCPPLDALLVSQIVDEYVSLERRYVLGDWEPAELDGGQFCEACARIIYHQDSGNLSHSKEFGDCLSYVEDSSKTHKLAPLKPHLHVARVLRTVYKFRSDRGVAHISATYTPNHMDSKIVLECCRWVIAEMLRLYWKDDRELVATVIRNLLNFDTPCIGTFGDRLVVQRVDLTPEEELLVLLHHGGDEGVSRSILVKSMFVDQSTVTRKLQKLQDAEHRQVVRIGKSDIYRLSDLGAKRVREELSHKLCLH
jgi:hypothetical protein